MTPAALLLAVTIGAPPASLSGPELDYTLHCAGCHMRDGGGSVAVPPLQPMRDLIASEEGRAYLVRVPGVAQAPLNDRRLAELLNWALRELADTEPQPPYTAAEVTGLRAQPLRDPIAERARILKHPTQ